jgi:hypothetical protein
MATAERTLRENDVVELIDPIGPWPAGRLGAIVSDYDDVKLVEIADEEGVMLDLIQVAEPSLKLISKHSV